MNKLMTQAQATDLAISTETTVRSGNSQKVKQHDGTFK